MARVLITGGSRGIGASGVRAFAARGDQVTFLYRSSHEEACRLSQETGARAICCDVSIPEQVEKAFAQLDGLDILVNNAGICHYGLLTMMKPDEWDRIFQVNVKSVYLCSNAAVPLFLRNHRGCIINMASMWGQVGASCEAAYSATKGAVIALSKALAQELGPSGIRVNAIAPGVILTDMVKNLSRDELEELAQQTPLERNGRPDDVAQAMLYLADAEFVTGQVLPVNGGFVIT